MTAPAGFRPLYRSAFGINWSMRRDDRGQWEFAATDDVEHVLDQNKRLANHGTHHNTDKTRYLAASIPMSVWLKWKTEEGWDAFDPNYKDKLKQKLNDPEWRHLRIWGGRL